MIIEFWLDQSVVVIFALLAALLGVTGLAAVLLFESRWTRGPSGRFSGVVAPFFTAISVLFALLTGFAANDAWERNRQATRAVLAERDALLSLHELSLMSVSDMSAIRQRLVAYLDAVMDDEWPRLRDGESSPVASKALSGLLGELARPGLSAEAGLALHESLLGQWQRLRTARSDRIAMSEQYSDHPKWWTIVILALLTQIALAFVHVGKPAASSLAVGLFTVAVVVTLSLVAVKERPFDGPLATPPTVLREARATIRAASPPAADAVRR